MAATPDEPNRPSGPPKYLPRIKYQPPEPDPDAEDPDEEDTDGAASPGTSAKGDASSKPKPKPDGTPAAHPPRAGIKPERAPSAPVAKATGKGDAPTPEPKPKRPPAEKSRPAGATDRPAKAGRGTLVEATPEAETFEGRQRIRMIVGAVAGVVCLLSVVSLWRSLRSDDVEIDPEPASPAAAPEVPRPQPKLSPAARKAATDRLIAEAQTLEKAGKADEALRKLESVLSDYGDTPSAKLAAAARDRQKQGLPMFPAGAAVIATHADSKAGDDPGEGDPPVEVPGGAEPPEAPVMGRPAKVVAAPPVYAASSGAVGSALAPEPRRPIEVGLPKADVPARALPPGFQPRPEAGVHASGWPLEIFCERDGASMMLVPGDRFLQGRDDGRPEERPAHRVQLSTFYIDQHEVTARQFAASRGGPPSNDDRPATGMTLDEARAYARWAGKSIPTEAQWEMAARTPDARIHPWGNAPASWGESRRPKQIGRVMAFPDDLSPYGVFDLAGNAWEWTSDWFDTKYYGQLNGQTPINPTGPPRGNGRLPEVVIKGGSPNWDASWRVGMRPDARLPHLGFRCVLNVEGAGAAPGAIPPSAPSAPAPSPAAPSPTIPPGTVPF